MPRAPRRGPLRRGTTAASPVPSVAPAHEAAPRRPQAPERRRARSATAACGCRGGRQCELHRPTVGRALDRHRRRAGSPNLSLVRRPTGETHSGERWRVRTRRSEPPNPACRASSMSSEQAADVATPLALDAAARRSLGSALAALLQSAQATARSIGSPLSHPASKRRCGGGRARCLSRCRGVRAVVARIRARCSRVHPHG
jgi:hypothetical protein